MPGVLKDSSLRARALARQRDTKHAFYAFSYWKDGYVGFLIDCSFSFEEALKRESIEIRHINAEQKCSDVQNEH